MPLLTTCGVHRTRLRASCPECLTAAAAARTLKARRLDALSQENKARRERDKQRAEEKKYKALLDSLRKPKLYRWTRLENGWLCGKHNEATFVRRDGTHCCRSCRAAASARWQREHGAERARQRKHDRKLATRGLNFKRL